MAECCWFGRGTKRDGSYRLHYISQNNLKSSSTDFKSVEIKCSKPLSTTEIHCLLRVIATSKCKTTVCVCISEFADACNSDSVPILSKICLGAELWGSFAPRLDNLAVLQSHDVITSSWQTLWGWPQSSLAGSCTVVLSSHLCRSTHWSSINGECQLPLWSAVCGISGHHLMELNCSPDCSECHKVAGQLKLEHRGSKQQ